MTLTTYGQLKSYWWNATKAKKNKLVQVKLRSTRKLADPAVASNLEMKLAAARLKKAA